MRKNDGSVLDWSKIMADSAAGQERRNPGDSRSAVNKGILFEDLIERLIQAMFPTETWRRTGKSYDGKKDFVFPGEESLANQKWAECKNYKSNLSLNIIAPTLIMGAIEHIACIFFFSYSPLNDNAIEGLLRYSEVEGRNVQIFDGSLLESAICRHSATHGISKFFPNTDFNLARTALEKKMLRRIQTLRDLNGNQIAPTHRFEQGEHFYLQTTIQNLTWEPIDCIVEVRLGGKSVLRCEAGEGIFTLPAADLKQYSILCEALQEGVSSVVVEITEQATRKKVKTSPQKIEVLDEPYLAWSGRNALRAREAGLRHLKKLDEAPLLIAGESGTGKSTLINILLSEADVLEKYRILKVDLNLPRITCMRALFSQALGIRGKEISPKDQADDDKKAISLLVDNYAKSASEIAEQVMSFYDKTHPYLFVLDDIQKVSGPYISLLQELDDRAKKDGVPIYYLLALNESVISVDELLSNLNWDEHYQNRVPELVRLAKFQNADILTYLKTRYGLQDIDSYFAGSELELTPLALHTFCAGLKESHVIARELGGQMYQVVDTFRFSERIKQILRAKIPLKRICTALDRNGVSEYILKYLYVTGKLSEKLNIHCKTIRKLTDQGLLKQTNDSVVFYHSEIRELIRETLTFSEDDYADIFDDPDTGDGAKALCVLEQPGKLRGGEAFLQTFWNSDQEIFTPSLREELCRLIFQQAEKLVTLGLFPDGLRFVRANFKALNEEHGHTSFFSFLKLMANTALRCHWDISKESVEDMAYFIKKFFDRALSSYHYQDCLSYFEQYEKLFHCLRNISDDRRNFWLSHYANRAAIALDRTSNPTNNEPAKVLALYIASQTYYAQAGICNTLDLQITVDEFNRHYIYRHDLTIQHVRDTYERLCRIQTAALDDPLDEPMVLVYHLRLLEYLRYLMEGYTLGELHNLLARVMETVHGCKSSFYEIKLRVMEIYLFIGLRCIPEAVERLSAAFEFAYKKELRSYIYRLTYIKTQLLMLQPEIFVKTDADKQAALALAQMLDVHGNEVNALRREAFLLVLLGRTVAGQDAGGLASLASRWEGDTKALLEQLEGYLGGNCTNPDVAKLFGMKSYFVFGDVSFPVI